MSCQTDSSENGPWKLYAWGEEKEGEGKWRKGGKERREEEETESREMKQRGLEREQEKKEGKEKDKFRDGARENVGKKKKEGVVYSS